MTAVIKKNSFMYASGFATIFFFLFVSICYGQSADIERIAPKPVPQAEACKVIERAEPDITPGSNRNQILVESLEGIVFLDDPTRINSQAVLSSGIIIDGLNKIDNDDFKSSFTPYLGQPLSLALLDKINRAVVKYFRDKGFPVVDSFAPQGQDISNGVVQIAVLVGKLGRVRVEGAEYFSHEKLASTIRLKPSDSLSKKLLQEDIQWLNKNPFRTVNTVLERGKEFGETDIVLKVDDRLPLRIYAGVDDTGTSLNGKQRWNAGFNWGNMFGLDHQLGYQFTSSFDIDELNAHSFNYLAPLSWRHTASFYGAYVKSNPPVTASGFNLSGKSWQLGGRYNIPLTTFRGLNHELNLGADFKRSNNDLEFGTLRVFNTFTNIIQFNLGYSASRQDDYGFTQFGGTMNISPGGVSNDNSDTAFNASRANATADYVYARFNLNRITRLPNDFSWTIDAQVQASNGNLLGSEQLGVGGYRTVRGYDEYEVVGDAGITLRNEIRAPAMSLLKKLNISGPHDNLQFLAFIDYAIVTNVDKLVGEHSIDLLSMGLGLRFNISSYLSLRADYGWQLTQLAPGVSKGNRMHVSLVIGY